MPRLMGALFSALGNRIEEDEENVIEIDAAPKRYYRPQVPLEAIEAIAAVASQGQPEAAIFGLCAICRPLLHLQMFPWLLGTVTLRQISLHRG